MIISVSILKVFDVTLLGCDEQLLSGMGGAKQRKLFLSFFHLISPSSLLLLLLLLLLLIRVYWRVYFSAQLNSYRTPVT